METQKHTVKAACMFAACAEPATVTVAISYPTFPPTPELGLEGHGPFTWDGGGRCAEHLEAELELATYCGATVTSTPISQGVPA